MGYSFNVYDYLVLSFVLGLSIVIGLYHAIAAKYGGAIKKYLKRDNKIEANNGNTEMKDYLIAGGQMSGLPIAFSLLASFFSATALLGIPAEVYQYGIEHSMFALGTLFTPIIGAFVTGPMFANLQLMSVFEYLFLRYNSNVIRLLATSFYIIRAILTTAIFIYGPATTLTTLSSLSTVKAIIILGSVATFYTTIGGIKAVIWTDFFQLAIMISGIVAVIWRGTSEVGGLEELWRINNNGGRLNFFDFNPDPFTRQTFWSLTIGVFIYFFGFYCIDQTSMQRYVAAKNKRHAKMALLLNVPASFIILGLCCFCGLVVYANYADCDPLSAPNVTNVRSPNQLMIYLITDKMKDIKGFTGLFVSSILSASLSSVSSALNSMAAIIWEDFLKQINYFNKFSDKSSTFVVKFVVLVLGTLATSIAVMISGFTGNLVQMSQSLNGSMISPVIGVFLLAGLFPFSNAYGAFAGMLSGFAMGLWLSYGAMVLKVVYPKLPVSTACYNNITTSSTTRMYTKLGKKAINLSGFNQFYSISFTWYTTVGVLTTLIVGIIVSLVTKGYKLKVDEKLLLKNYVHKARINKTKEETRLTTF